jgi:CMP/dCMP kinase
MAAPTVVTISRQLGSGGSQVGQIVAARLSYSYADREVLHLAAESLGVDEGELCDREEKLTSIWETMGPPFVYAWPDAPYVAPPVLSVSDDQLYSAERRIIQDLAASGNCVIVGRGGVHILQGHPGAVHVLLHAPIGLRVHRAMEVYEISSEDDALHLVQQSDRARERFFRRMAGHDWMCATNYHLALDTSVVSLDHVAQLIVDYVRLVQSLNRRAGIAVQHESPPAD